jgi:creatinine amidohydrolase
MSSAKRRAANATRPFDDRDYACLRWEEMSWVEVERCAKEGRIALIPLGSVEQHGPMIPVGCDFFLAHTWALEGARKAHDEHGVPVVVLPAIPYGRATQHMDFPGTVSLSLDCYVKLLQEIVREVIRAGFRKIACVSGHGGNIAPAHEALRDLAGRLKAEGVSGVRLYMADSHNCFSGAEEMYAKMPQGQFNFHADAVETSYYMFVRPDLVKREGMVKPKVKCDRMPLHVSWFTKDDITETGSSGDPTLANAEYGKDLYRYCGDALAAFLKRVWEDRR